MNRRWEWTHVECWATLDNLQIWSWWGKSLSLWKSSNLPRQGSFYLKLYLFPFAYIFIWPLWTQNFLVVYLFSNKPFRVQVKPVRAGPGVRRIRRAAVSRTGPQFLCKRGPAEWSLQAGGPCSPLSDSGTFHKELIKWGALSFKRICL